MSQKLKQVALYAGLLILCGSYSLIFPFYPEVAKSKGVPIWLIGAIFSLNPVASLLTSIFLSKYMIKIGRKVVLFLSFLFTSVSMIILSPIEYCELDTVIILSVISRLIGGLGSGCIFTSIITVFISDFPDNIQNMIGRMEAAIGLGLISGPLFGITLNFIDLFTTLFALGCLIFVFSLVAWPMLGKFKPYEVQNVEFDRIRLFFKPVSEI